MMDAMEITPSHREQAASLGHLEQRVLGHGRVLLMERLEPVKALGLQPVQDFFEPFDALQPRERMSQEHAAPRLVDEADRLLGSRGMML